MVRVPKTTIEEHETPNRVRFQFLIEQGETQAEAALILKLPRGTANYGSRNAIQIDVHVQTAHD